ncbi:hypothetical protein [Pseudomonas sp. LT1P18]|uniref:hypothetical protein n=1 Tax=Pseudomonas arabinosi TaxID=3398357 RepID=UPI0039F0F75A
MDIHKLHLLPNPLKMDNLLKGKDMESQQQPGQSKFWSTVSKLVVAVPLAALIGSGLTALVMGGIDYGQLKSSLDSEKNRTLELQKSNDELSDLLVKWREAVAQRDILLSSTQGKLAAIQNDQCESISMTIYTTESTLDLADSRGFSDKRRAELSESIRLHQQSLQACFASRK